MPSGLSASSIDKLRVLLVRISGFSAELALVIRGIGTPPTKTEKEIDNASILGSDSSQKIPVN